MTRAHYFEINSYFCIFHSEDSNKKYLKKRMRALLLGAFKFVFIVRISTKWHFSSPVMTDANYQSFATSQQILKKVFLCLEFFTKMILKG